MNGFSFPQLPHEPAAEFVADRSPFFVSNGDGAFRERGLEVGIDDRGQGRGVVAFDYDRDHDLDLFIAQNSAPPRLFRNDSAGGRHSLTVLLAGRPPNTQGIGARIYVTAGGTTQMRELRAGNNFVSQDPAEAFFGLGSDSVADEVRVRWPDGSETSLQDVSANQVLVVTQELARRP